MFDSNIIKKQGLIKMAEEVVRQFAKEIKD